MSGNRALIINHLGYPDPGAFSVPLAAHSLEYEYLYRDHDPFPKNLDGIQLVISLGSKWSAARGDESEPVHAELDLLERAVDFGVPVIGVCYGAQLLARVFGAEVFDLSEPVLGWQETSFSGGTMNSQSQSLFYWNSQGFEAPKGALKLAATEDLCQAFRFGRVFGLQFHLDVTRSLLKRWMGEGLTPNQVHENNDWLLDPTRFALTGDLAQTLTRQLIG